MARLPPSPLWSKIVQNCEEICIMTHKPMRGEEDNWPGWKLQLLILPNPSKNRSKIAEMREIIGQSDGDHTILPGGGVQNLEPGTFLIQVRRVPPPVDGHGRMARLRSQLVFWLCSCRFAAFAVFMMGKQLDCVYLTWGVGGFLFDRPESFENS